MNSRPVRVLLPPDRMLVRYGLRALLAPHHERVEVVDSGPADVALVDGTGLGPGRAVPALPTGNGAPAPRAVVVVDDRPPDSLVRQALDARAGLVLSSESGGALADALVRAAGGAVVVSPALEAEVAAAGARRWPGEDRGLSRRESQVLVMIALGHSPEEISQGLTIAHETVRSHLKRVYHKLGVRDRATAVARAWNEGIVDHWTVAAGRAPGGDRRAG